jgi:hypothetical protein
MMRLKVVTMMSMVAVFPLFLLSGIAHSFQYTQQKSVTEQCTQPQTPLFTMRITFGRSNNHHLLIKSKFTRMESAKREKYFFFFV